MVKIHVVEVTPTITAGAYSANDQIGGIQTIALPEDVSSSGGRLVHIHVVDKAAQSAALQFFFFDELPTVASADGDACNVSDAEMADKAIFNSSVAAAAYFTTSANSLGSSGDDSQGHVFKPKGNNLYAVVKTTGTPTYTSTSDLVFKYAFEYEGP